MRFIEEKENGSSARTYSFTANAEEWRLIHGMAARLRGELPNGVMTISPIIQRLRNICKEIRDHVPGAKAVSYSLEEVEKVNY